MTSPVISRLAGGPCRHGVAMTSIVGRPGASRRVVGPRRHPIALPPSRFAPDSVVSTTPADGSSARPASSRLSAWWSWLSSTASIGPMSAAAIAGPAAFRDADPQPKVYLPAGGVERRIGQQPPAVELDERGRPADMGDADDSHTFAGNSPQMGSQAVLSARCPGRMGERPIQGVVGDLLPAVLRGQQVHTPLIGSRTRGGSNRRERCVAADGAGRGGDDTVQR